MEVVGAVAGVITLASAVKAASHARKLSRRLRSVLKNTQFIDKDIRSKALHFRTFGDAIDIACWSLQGMQSHQGQSEVLEKIANHAFLRDLDEKCQLVKERLFYERGRIERLDQGLGLFGKKFRVLSNIKWEFSLKNAIVSLEPEVNGIQLTLSMIIGVATFELHNLRMSDPRISLEEYERLKLENQRLTRQLETQESTVKLLLSQNLTIFSAFEGGRSVDGSTINPQIEDLIRLSETARHSRLAPRPAAAPGNQDRNQGPPPTEKLDTRQEVLAPGTSTPVTGPRTTSRVNLPEVAPWVIKLGATGRQWTIELTGRNGKVSCAALVDKSNDFNFVSYDGARAAGWRLKQLQNGDPTIVEYSDGRREEILSKCVDSIFTDKDRHMSQKISCYVCKNLTPEVRLGRIWAERFDT